MATEKRMIALDDLMKFPIRIDHYDKEHGNEHFVLGIETVLEYAEQLPTVDAVEVVRCKDCKNRVEWRNAFMHCSFTGIQTEDDDFCSYGEKGDGDGNG